MLDNQLNIILREQLGALFPSRASLTVEFKQNYQPTQQSRKNAATVYFKKLFDHRYGYRSNRSEWNEDLQVMQRIEEQVIESTFQFAVTMNIDPNDETAYTHSDVLKLVASVVQSPDFIKELYKNGLQVLRVMDIRNTPYQNDRDNFEDNPTFDVIITHTDTFIDGVPVVTKFVSSIHRV